MATTSPSGPDDDLLRQWRTGVESVLRKSGWITQESPPEPENLLNTPTADGFALKPLYTAADLPEVLPPPDPGDAGWLICPRLVVGSSASDSAQLNAAQLNDEVLHELETGATALWLTVGPDGVAPEALGTVLAGVRSDLAPVVVTPSGGLAAAEAAFAWAAEQPGADVSLGVDPLTQDLPVAAIADLVTRAAAMDADVRVVVADGTAAVEAGGTPAQQLALAVASAIQILRELAAAGVDPSSVPLDLRLAATTDQFATIATMRAARVLWARVAEVLGVTTVPRLHAVTASVMMSVHDPWVNLLRTTVAAFAAGTGGADLVTVQPFDARLGVSDAFSRRLARNTQSLLLLESHVGAVNDPGAGSYYIEALTAELAATAWGMVQQIEAAGGMRDALPQLREWVAEAWADRRKQLARRKQPLTGVSEFPILDQPPVEREPLPDGIMHPRLEPVHYAGDFEELRAIGSGTVPVVLLGTVASSSARAGFATNFLGVGGFQAVPVGPVQGADELPAALAAAQVSLTGPVMVAGPDRMYQEVGTELVEALRAQGFSQVIVAGKQAVLPDADSAVALGSDVVEQLKTLGVGA